MRSQREKKALEYEGNTLWRRNAEVFEQVAKSGLK